MVEVISMCDTCGCGERQVDVEVKESLFSKNRALGEENRRFVEAKGAKLVNLISAPGSGKTTLLEATITHLMPKVSIGVIEGDIETERDAQRIRATGARAVQITTGGACHLDAVLVHKALHTLFEGDNHLDLIFIENVGNLVCPASFYLGEHLRCILVSVPEGSDKPSKYPTTFKDADVFAITKTDLLPYFDFSVDEAAREARRINPGIQIVEVSAKTQEGMADWIHALGMKI